MSVLNFRVRTHSQHNKRSSACQSLRHSIHTCREDLDEPFSSYWCSLSFGNDPLHRQFSPSSRVTSRQVHTRVDATYHPAPAALIRPKGSSCCRTKSWWGMSSPTCDPPRLILHFQQMPRPPPSITTWSLKVNTHALIKSITGIGLRLVTEAVFEIWIAHMLNAWVCGSAARAIHTVRVIWDALAGLWFLVPFISGLTRQVAPPPPYGCLFARLKCRLLCFHSENVLTISRHRQINRWDVSRFF